VRSIVDPFPLRSPPTSASDALSNQGYSSMLLPRKSLSSAPKPSGSTARVTFTFGPRGLLLRPQIRLGWLDTDSAFQYQCLTSHVRQHTHHGFFGVFDHGGGIHAGFLRHGGIQPVPCISLRREILHQWHRE